MGLLESLFGTKCAECGQKITGEKFPALGPGWLCQTCYRKLEEERKQKDERRQKDPEKRRQAALKLGNSNDAAVVDHLIAALEDTNNEVRLTALKALSAFILEFKKRQEMVRRGTGPPISDAELTALRKARKAVQGRTLEVEQYMRAREIERIRRHEERSSRDRTTPGLKGLIFRPRCPMCRVALDQVSRPRGVMSSGTVVCHKCKQQISLRVSPKDSRLYVRMLTLPIQSVDPGETAWDPLPEVTQKSRTIKQEGREEKTLTVGKRLTGERHRVSNDTSKANRAGKCRDCGVVVELAYAREVCLDWDGVDAYHFYCSRCYRGTGDPHYYTGQLIGSDGDAVIDQHSWYYER